MTIHRFSQSRCTLWLILGFIIPVFCLAQKNPKDSFVFRPLNDLVTPEVQRVNLPNGLRIFLVEDHEVQLITVRALVKVSSICDPPGQIGLAAITGTSIHAGGTETLTGEKIDEMLELMGGSLRAEIGDQSGEVSLTVFKQDVDMGLELMADLLMRPAFRTDKVELTKAWQRSAIARRNDQAGSVLAREFAKLIYGPTSPYARHPEYSTIDAVTQADVRRFHGSYFVPNNTILGVWGDFQKDAMLSRIKELFATWERKEMPAQMLPQVEYEYAQTINVIPKPDLNQSHILMGHIGGVMSDPDYPALLIMNHILTSDRMFNTIRSREGLTYAPWGVYGAEYDHRGVFSCGTQTKSQSTVYAIRLMIGEVERMASEDVTESEITRAKESYLNSFIFNFDTKDKVMNRLMTYALFGYPLDFAERTKREIEAVTRADVHRAARKYLKPDKMQILVVGNEGEFDKPLAALGSVKKIDIEIPPRQ